jgi:Mg-chelatase subunit ChlD
MDDLMVLEPEGLTMTTTGGKRTAIYLLLDASGSMWNNKKEHLGGVNGFIEKMKMDGNRYTITLDIFNSTLSEPKTLREGNLEDIAFITEEEYLTTGGTPLLDSAWEIIGKAERDSEEGDKIAIVIQTDGEENDSREVKLEALKKKIKSKRDDGWLFEFLGMGIDAFTGEQMGFASASASSYTSLDSNEEWSVRSDNIGTYASTGKRPEDLKWEVPNPVDIEKKD